MRPEPAIDIRVILGLLRRQIRTITATLIVILAAMAVILFSITPIYTATALIMVDPGGNSALDSTTQMTNAGADSARVDSEVEIIASDRVLIDVISELDLKSDEEFGLESGLRDRLMALFRISGGHVPSDDEPSALSLENLREKISVRRRGLTYLIAVEADSRDKNKAAWLANAIAKSYVKIQLQSKIEGTLTARDTIQRRIDQAEKAVVDAERRLDNFILDNTDRIVAVTGRTDLADMRDQIRSLELQRENASRLANTGGKGLVMNLEDPSPLRFENKDELITQSLSQALRGAVDTELRGVPQQMQSDARDRITASSIRMSIDGKRLNDFRQQFNLAVLEENLPPDILAEIYGLQQISRNARNQYDTLLARVQMLETEAEIQIADSRIVSPALPPNEPSFPNMPVFFAVAGVMGLTTGVGFGFLFENFVGGFTSEEQVEAVTHRPLISVIPRQPVLNGSTSISDCLLDKPLSAYAESIRRLRASVDRMLLDEGEENGHGQRKGSVIMVSSALPSEGKTTTALSLARAYAISGKKTLIIDCDFRKPSVHRDLGITPIFGLGQFLLSDLDKTEIRRTIVNDAKTGLSAIVGSRRIRQPSDQLLTENAFRGLLEGARKQFDRVILDSAPILPVVDGAYLVQYAQICVFVVRLAATPQRAAVTALRTLDAAKPTNCEVACVLNQQEIGGSSYYSSYSNYFVE